MSNGFSKSKGFEFTATGAEMDITDGSGQDPEGLVNRILLKTDDVEAREDRDKGEIAVKPRVRRKVGETNGIPEYKNGQKPEPEEVPESIIEIAQEAEEDEVNLEATVTELDRSKNPEMDGEDKIYFINSDDTDSLTQKVFSEGQEEDN